MKINLGFDKENWEYFNGKISNEAVVLADNQSNEASFFLAPKQTTVVMTGELDENKIPKLKYYSNWIPKGTKVEAFKYPEKIVAEIKAKCLKENDEFSKQRLAILAVHLFK